MKIGLGVFLVFFLVIISCSDKENVVPDLGLDYYPLQVGNYAIYQVDEMNISGSTTTEMSYELKVSVADSSINEKGEVTYFLLREKRETPSASWESVDTWSAKMINYRIIQNEGNVLFVKLIFPPSMKLKWDGNQYNNLPDNGEIFYDGSDTPYFISEIDKPISLSTGFDAEHSLTVIQNDLNDVITGKDERKEIYAKGVGLIYKEINQLVKCNGTTCSGDRSYIFIQSMKEHGKI